MLDNDATLFAPPGDDRVASLFLWHFVEEVEHRSSALIIYNGLVGDPWYRARVAPPSIFKHVMDVVRMACDGFNRHIPLEVRKVDAVSTFALERGKNALLQRIGRRPDYGPFQSPFPDLGKREMLAALVGIVRSQIPGHDPAHEKLPALAAEWFKRYDEGYDVTKWYTSAKASADV